MEVRSDIFNTISDYVKRSKAEKLECEAVLKHKIDTQTFTELLQYFSSSDNFKRHVYADNTDDSLDIIAKINEKNVRTTLLGSEVIKTYCISGDIPDESEMITKTVMADHISLSDYYFRVNLKSEKPVEDRATYVNELKKSLKVFRLKRRFSFMDTSNNFRFDMTIVKSNGMNPVKSFIKSNVMKAHETYEVEVEYLNTAITDKAATEQLLKYMLVVLRVVFKTKSVIKQSESHAIMLNYLKLVNNDYLSNITKKYNKTSDLVTELLKSPNKIFFAYNPVTLELQNINTDDIVQNDNVLSEDANYSVTEKADGERNILFVADNNKVYLINNRFSIIDTGLTSTRENTLIDGELIRTDKSGNDYNVFMCFDMYYDKGTDIRGLPFISPEYKKVDDDRYNLLRKNIESLKGDSIFKVDVKKFFTRDRDVKKRAKITGKNLLQVADEYIWNNRNIMFPYNIDGLIFQPTKLGVGAIYQNEVIEYRFGGSWNKVYKWKPPDENTIDMLIEYKITDKALIDGFVACKLYVNDNTKMQNIDPLNIANGIYEVELASSATGNMRQFRECKLPLKDGNVVSHKYEVITDRDIVEFSYNDDDAVDELHKWIPNKIRKDKTELYKKTKRIDGTANSYMVAMNVWKSIKNPVTDKMITGNKNVTDAMAHYDNDVYSMRNVDRFRIQMKPLMNFHNEYVKNRHLIGRFKSKRFSLFDIGCGKGSDMAKYVDRGHTTGFKLVVGADHSFDSILGASDSAWSRYLMNITNNERYKQFNPKKNPMMFIQLNGKKKWDDDYFKTITNDKLRFMTQVLWDTNVPENIPEYNTPFVKQYIGQVKTGFDVVNCQFAIHYFFENAETLDTFCKNINSVLKVGGYFIGTCFDGDRVNNVFEVEKKDTVIRQKNNNVMWMIRKKYAAKDPKIGRKIDVFVESINQVVEEYLVYFDILKEKLKEFNIEVLSKEELKKFELSTSHGSFDKIYRDNVDDVNFKDKMDDTMKEYSFLNEWFIFKKK